MSRQYVEISLEEMQDFLVKLGFENDSTDTSEIKFTRKFQGGDELTVWTSLSLYGQNPYGTDAIRIVVYKKLANVRIKMSHTKRLANWKETLRNKIGTAIVRQRLTNIPNTCAYCGDPDVNGTNLDGNKVCAYHEVALNKTLLDHLFGSVTFAMSEGI